MPSDEFEPARVRMVDEQLKTRGLIDERLIAAFRKVPRHLFVPKEFQRQAYEDHPLPIGVDQTISQPYIVALMVSLLRLQGHERVLEIGTGSGYQAAILAELALEVYSIERIQELILLAGKRLERLGYQNVHLQVGDGSLGWAEHAPFDGIIVSAAAPRIPKPLLEQLGDTARMILPIGPQHVQTLVEVQKNHGEIFQREIAGCVFVPLLGRCGWSS
jgi:protein-L-isoaspartate(D-aspartate) O-methyltransferase